MNTKELIDELAIWDRWTYSFIDKTVICYGSWIFDFDEKTEEFVTTYRPRYWIKCDFKTFLRALQDKDTRKNFRWAFDNELIIEREKGEPIEEGELIEKGEFNHLF